MAVPSLIFSPACSLMISAYRNGMLEDIASTLSPYGSPVQFTMAITLPVFNICTLKRDLIRNKDVFNQKISVRNGNLL